MNTAQHVADRWAGRLMNLVKEHGHLHLLLNRFDGLDQRLIDPIRALPQQWPLTDPYYGEAIERTPLLVTLTMDNLPLLDITALIAAEAALDPALPAPTVCAWLQSGASTERLAGHLRRHLDLRLEGHKKSVFFCNFDPRVIPLLPHMLDAAQIARLLGPVSRWLVPGRDAQLLEVSPPAASEAPTSVSVFGLRLGHAQAQALERIETLNAAVRAIQTRQRVPHTDDARLDALIQRAIGLGLEQADDQAAYAALAYTWPAGRGPIESDEQVTRGIELARAGLPLADYLQQNPSTTSDHP